MYLTSPSDFIYDIHFFQVHKKLGLSPGTATSSTASLRDKDVTRKREISKTKEFKVHYMNICLHNILMIMNF